MNSYFNEIHNYACKPIFYDEFIPSPNSSFKPLFFFFFRALIFYFVAERSKRCTTAAPPVAVSNQRPLDFAICTNICVCSLGATQERSLKSCYTASCGFCLGKKLKVICKRKINQSLTFFFFFFPEENAAASFCRYLETLPCCCGMFSIIVWPTST